MKIRVQLFAAAREQVGATHIEIEMGDAATVADVKRRIAERYPELKHLLLHSLLAVNRQYAQDAQLVPPHAEVGLIPPVSGG